MRALIAVNLAIVAAAGAAVALAHAGGCSAPRPSAARLDRFDEAAAWALVKRQVAVGQRPAGSPQLRALAADLVGRLPAGHFETLPDAGLRNVVGTLPGRRPGIVIGAHYDTLTSPPGFVGANNGAAGTAIVVRLARDLARLRRPRGAREIRFVLFDGEEPPNRTPEQDPDFYRHSLRGSKAYLATYRGRTAAMLLLDYVGNRGLRLPREGSSSPALWNEVRAAARSAGVAKTFPGGTQTTIFDDHTPFLRAAVPAVDFIDWSYDGHSLTDTLDKLRVRSLDAVGETVIETVRRMDRRLDGGAIPAP